MEIFSDVSLYWISSTIMWHFFSFFMLFLLYVLAAEGKGDNQEFAIISDKCWLRAKKSIESWIFTRIQVLGK